jgi:hypothetical protein
MTAFLPRMSRLMGRYRIDSSIKPVLVAQRRKGRREIQIFITKDINAESVTPELRNERNAGFTRRRVATTLLRELNFAGQFHVTEDPELRRSAQVQA